MAQPSPIALAIVHPGIAELPTEDEDDVPAPDAFPDGETSHYGGGSQIVIGDEQIDENPFDPSLPEEYYI